jgi:hypothetical protein
MSESTKKEHEVLRPRFDLITKELLLTSLGPLGRQAEKEYEIATSGMARVDFAFEPDPARSADRERLGLLGRMTSESCFIEVFHRPPGRMLVLGCVRKQLAHALVMEREALTSGTRVPDKPRLFWVVSSGRPDQVLEQFGARRIVGWPRGVYDLVPGAHVRAMVANELPKGRDTLFMRLFGSGRALKTALGELRKLDQGQWERDLALELFVQQRLTIETTDQISSEEDAELIMATNELVEEFKRKHIEIGRRGGLREGRREGRREGARRAIVRLYERRFGPMPQDLRDVLEAQQDEGLLDEWNAIVGTEPMERVTAAFRAP